MAKYVFTVKIDTAFMGKSINAVMQIELEAPDNDTAREFAKQLFILLYNRFNIICIDHPTEIIEKR